MRLMFKGSDLIHIDEDGLWPEGDLEHELFGLEYEAIPCFERYEGHLLLLSMTEQFLGGEVIV